MKKLLVTDLDDTLYNWMDFFVPSFFAMVDEVARITGLDEQLLYAQYKEKHLFYGSVEYPYVTLNLPAVRGMYPGKTEDELKEIFRPAFQIFNSVRDAHLHLYPGVEETLKAIQEMGITIVGFTESSQENGFYRLIKLGISQFFTHVYLLESDFSSDFIPNEQVRKIRSKKPNKDLLLNICRQEGFSPADAIYTGDSLTKDVYMARHAGVTSVWVDHPNKNAEYARRLLSITSWTDEEYAAEQARKQEMKEKGIAPDYVIHRYSDLLEILRES